MRRIIPFIIFFAAIAYLFYSPAPMDEIGEIVKTRNCYQLRLMDQERLSLPSENVKSIESATASIQKGNSSQKRILIKKQKHDNFSLALSHQGK